MAGLYLHIPFCRQACHYCDFHFSTRRDTQPQLVEAIVRELEIRQSYLQGDPVATVYYGGGTPSLLSRNELLLLNAKVNSVFGAHSREVTYEANPEDLTEEQLSNLLEAGGNRLSIGVQSFDDSVLKYFNRRHDARSARSSVGRSRKAGFTNVSIDLIFAVPGMTLRQWGETVAEAIALKPDHISAYSLTIEDRTAFGVWQKQGKLTAASEEEAAAQLEHLCDRMEAAGYERYEVSNFSKPGFASQHNSTYWRWEKYLGVGPGAHSFDLFSRQWNVRNNNRYVKALAHESVPFEREELSPTERANDYLLTSLRTSAGCSLSFFGRICGEELTARKGDQLERLIGRGHARLEGDSLCLTRSGLLLADRIAMELFL
jgi:oxygen-independent coproporphyrinogen-3 oxidase